MSDDDDFESGEDFSASEDEWTPGNLKEVEHSDEEEDTEGDVEDFETVPLKKRKKDYGNIKEVDTTKKNVKVKKSQKLRVASLRDKMFKKYKPPPKTISLNKSMTNSNLSATKSTEEMDSDSGSSVENFLVNPEKLDLKSSYFDVKTNNEGEQKGDEDPPNFDCNVGISSNHSENEDDIETIEDEAKNKQNDLNVSPFKQFYEYKNTIDQVKENVESIKSNPVVIHKQDDISSLLALGEASTSKSDKGANLKKLSQQSKKKNSDSEWEEVEEEEIENITGTKENIEIFVAFPEARRKNEKKATDEQAQMMRKLNRIIKENCLVFHKVSLLCHIAHGNYLNRALNNPTLMAEALKLLPSPKSYPDGRTSIKYFESISKWYKAIMLLKSESVHSDLKNRPPIPISLALQIKTKAAICKKDFVLIFIVLLRSMGIQSRLVINLVPLPFRPASDDLCSLKKKKIEVKQTVVEKSKNKSQSKINKCEKMLSETQSEHFKSKRKNNEKNKTKNSPEEKNKTNSLPSTHSNKNERNPPEPEKKIFESKRKTKEINKTKHNSVEEKDKLISSSSNSSLPIIKVNEKKAEDNSKIFSPIKTRMKRKIDNTDLEKNEPSTSQSAQNSTKSHSTSPKLVSTQISKSSNPAPFERQNSRSNRTKKTNPIEKSKPASVSKSRSPSPKFFISTAFCQKKVQKNDDPEIRKKSLREKLKVPQLDGADSIPNEKMFKKSLKDKVYADNSESDSDFEVSPPKKQKTNTQLLINVQKDRRVLSTDDEKDVKKKRSMDLWVEVFSETEDQWISIDLFTAKVHCIDSLRKGATSPVSYVFAWNNDNSLKDVSPRYCPQWNTVTRKQRVDKEWLKRAIKKFLGKKNSRDVAEDRELEKIHIDKPLPTTINEFKNHPLYVLERHLLKFEVIYPPNPPTLGFVRGEPIYPRDCVHTCHSRDIWLKEAKVVKLGENPYKIVKSRPKWDKVSNSVIKDLPLEIFGFWQTKDYEPPTAENGIVPRNAYGNVELFKPTMLPKKTVHLQLPGLNRICKKLRIDCAPAVIGFDFHQGSCHPLLDGFVICEEYKDQIIEAWEADQQEQARKELEKYENRVYGNWKRLIKGLFIREKLKIKYNFGDVCANEKI